MDTIGSAQEAWRRYTSTGAIAPGLLRAHVYRAWQRSHERGANPCLPCTERLAERDTRRLLDHQRGLITRARPFLKALSDAVGDQSHAALIGDAHGVVLDVVGTTKDKHVFAPGTLCTEETIGANGVSTTLAEGRYVEILGPEHFMCGLQMYACQAAPIRGPDGETVGVLSTALRQPEPSARMRAIFLCSSRALEAELIQARLEEDARLVRERADPEAEDLERLRQDIVQIHTAARLNLTLAGRTNGARLEAASRLIRAADRAIRRFQRLATFWRMLAGHEVDSGPLDLSANLWLLSELLQTELAVRAVDLTLELPDAGPLVSVTAFRRIFHQLMAAVELAGRGGKIRVQVWKGTHDGEPSIDSVVSFEVTPGPDQPDRTRQRWALNLGQMAHAPSPQPDH